MRRALLLALVLAAPAAGADEPPPDALIAELPFVHDEEANRVMVDLAAEGARPFVMMLDTGATASVVTPGMARELGVRVRKLKDTPYRRSTRLGRDLQFWIDTASSDTAARTGWEYGLLGGDFLDDYVLEVDFPARRVRFFDPERYAVPKESAAPNERVVDVKVVSSRVIAPIEVKGRALGVMLDTGAPLPAVLSGAAAREVGIEVESLPPFVTSGTVLGPMETRLYEEPAFGFAGFALGPAALQVAPKGWYNQGAGNDSALGYDALAPFVMRIDYPRRRLWLRRVHEAPIRFWGADYGLAKQTGAFVTEVRGGYAVWRVTPGSPAERLGVRVGDVVVSSEGAKAPPVDEVLRRILDGDELQVARRQGELWVDIVLPEEPASD